MKKITLLLMCLASLSASAGIWRLNNNPGIHADFTTFEEAQQAANQGDTIYFEGTGSQSHYGHLTITKKLVLIGPGYFLNQNDSTYADKISARVVSVVIEPSAEGTEIYGLYFEYIGGGHPSHLTIKANGVIIARNSFQLNSYNKIKITANVVNVSITQNYAQQIEVSSGISATNLLISNNYLDDRISLNSLCSAVILNNVIRHGCESTHYSQIKNNIVFASGLSDALCVNNTGNNIAYNLISNSLISGGNYGVGNLWNVDMSTVFVGYPNQSTYSSDGRYKLKSGSPAIQAGEGNIDCGMYGGPLCYVLSGLPPIPRIYEAIIPAAGSSQSGLPIIIKAKSQN